jgi:hypothetical protein
MVQIFDVDIKIIKHSYKIGIDLIDTLINVIINILIVTLKFEHHHKR